MRTGKEPGVPAATFPDVAWKPNGKFGKSMNTVPAKPVLGTTCTVRGSVMLCVTGAGALLVVAGFRLSEKSGCKTSAALTVAVMRSEEHTSELQSRGHLVCRLLLEKKK